MNCVKSVWRSLNDRLQTPWVQKLMRDNVGVLATIIAWNALTSLVPIIVGLVAISGLLLQGHLISQGSMVSHLSSALQGALSRRDLHNIVATSTQHTGLLGIIGLVGVLWGASNVGGAISTAFQPIFEVSGRNFIKEKLLDVVMVIAIAVLMIVIISATTYSALVDQLFRNFPLSAVAAYAVGIGVGIAAAFLLFAAIYAAFPNTEPRLRFGHVWQGAFVAAVLFELLTLAWPIYAHFGHFSRYGAVLFPILLLTAWLYFFALILVVGAEVVAIPALREANRGHRAIGPEPNGSVPQHRFLRQV